MPRKAEDRTSCTKPLPVVHKLGYVSDFKFPKTQGSVATMRGGSFCHRRIQSFLENLSVKILKISPIRSALECVHFNTINFKATSRKPQTRKLG